MNHCQNKCNQLTPIQQAAYVLFCVKEVCDEKVWNIWADNWLENKDRTNILARKIVITTQGRAARAACETAAQAFELSREITRVKPARTAIRLVIESIEKKRGKAVDFDKIYRKVKLLY